MDRASKSNFLKRTSIPSSNPKCSLQLEFSLLLTSRSLTVGFLYFLLRKSDEGIIRKFFYIGFSSLFLIAYIPSVVKKKSESINHFSGWSKTKGENLQIILECFGFFS